MKLENKYSTVEQSKRLKELGVIQGKSERYWYTGDTGNNVDHLNITGSNYAADDLCHSAFDVAELSAMLPNFYPSWRFPVPGQNKNLWCATVICGPKPEGDGNIHTAPEFDRHADTQAKALATLLIALLETQTISVEEINQRLQNS